MRDLKELEYITREYADAIEEIIDVPRSNEQLVDLCKSIIKYLRLNADCIKENTDRVDRLKGFLYKLP